MDFHNRNWKSKYSVWVLIKTSKIWNPECQKSKNPKSWKIKFRNAKTSIFQKSEIQIFKIPDTKIPKIKIRHTNILKHQNPEKLMIPKAETLKVKIPDAKVLKCTVTKAKISKSRVTQYQKPETPKSRKIKIVKV